MRKHPEERSFLLSTVLLQIAVIASHISGFKVVSNIYIKKMQVLVFFSLVYR